MRAPWSGAAVAIWRWLLRLGVSMAALARTARRAPKTPPFQPAAAGIHASPRELTPAKGDPGGPLRVALSEVIATVDTGQGRDCMTEESLISHQANGELLG